VARLGQGQGWKHDGVWLLLGASARLAGMGAGARVWPRVGLGAV